MDVTKDGALLKQLRGRGRMEVQAAASKSAAKPRYRRLITASGKQTYWGHESALTDALKHCQQLHVDRGHIKGHQFQGNCEVASGLTKAAGLLN